MSCWVLVDGAGPWCAVPSLEARERWCEVRSTGDGGTKVEVWHGVWKAVVQVVL